MLSDIAWCTSEREGMTVCNITTKKIMNYESDCRQKNASYVNAAKLSMPFFISNPFVTFAHTVSSA